MSVSQFLGQKNRSSDIVSDKKKGWKVKGQYDICMLTQDTAPHHSCFPNEHLLHFHIYNTNQHGCSAACIRLQETMRASWECHAYVGVF